MPGPFCYDYPRPAITVDLVAFRCREGVLQTLLIRRKHDPFAGRWAFPGGFLEMDETGEQGARREFQEETSVPPPATVYFLGVFDAPQRDPRGRTISLSHIGLMPSDAPAPQGADDASESAWVDIAKLDASTLAFDHAAILDAARRWLTCHARDDATMLALLGDSPFARETACDVFRAITGHARYTRPWLDRQVQSGQLRDLGAGRFQRVGNRKTGRRDPRARDRR